MNSEAADTSVPDVSGTGDRTDDPEVVAALGRMRLANISPTEIASRVLLPDVEPEELRGDIEIGYRSRPGEVTIKIRHLMNLVGRDDEQSGADEVPAEPATTEDDPKGEEADELGSEEDTRPVVAQFDVSLQVVWNVSGDEELANEIVEALVPTAAFIVMPHLRELIQSLSVRMQMPPVILGMLHRGQLGPAEVSIVNG